MNEIITFAIKIIAQVLIGISVAILIKTPYWWLYGMIWLLGWGLYNYTNNI